MKNLNKFRRRRNKVFVGILIFLFLPKSGIQYLCKGKLVFVLVLVLLKVVPVKNYYFLHRKFESHTYQQVNGFLYWQGFY